MVRGNRGLNQGGEMHMADVTVTQLAKLLDITVDKLMLQLKEAGIEISADDESISGGDKKKLLDHLKRSHNPEEESTQEEGDKSPRQITLRRKKVSTLKVSGAGGRKTVNVEVRKKRTYVKRSVVEADEQDKAEDELKQQAEALAAEEAKQAPEVAEEVVTAVEETAPVVDDVTPVEATKEEPSEKADSKLSEEQKKIADQQAGAEKKTDKPVKTTKVEKKVEKKAKPDARSNERNKRSGKASKQRILELAHGGDEQGGRRKRKRKRMDNAGASLQQAFEMPSAPRQRDVSIPETITVADLAAKMSVKVAEVIKVMMNMGAMVTINQVIDQDTAVIVAEEMGHKVKLLKADAVEDDIAFDVGGAGSQVTRPPVVTIMGHVDHGKTSLLDYIRKTHITSGEAGGITQHIGAYHVETDHGIITFLDTPGHEAFTAMRARGAKATDIVILVVAADDGVMPQTIEAIQHARAAEVPIIVAVNKIDKPEADLERVRSELSNYEVISEDWGGENMFVSVSAKTGEGVEALLDSVLVQSEVLELQAYVNCPARGIVIESSLDKGRGPVASILVQQGQLRKGDILLAGLQYGRVRALLDENGKTIEMAGPSIPVEVLGLSGTPKAGDDAAVVASERKAREVALFRQGKFRDVKLARQQATKLESLMDRMSEGEASILNLIIKTDVQGSAEALNESLIKLSTNEVKVNIIVSGAGAITESDINLALASGAAVIGFNVRADNTGRVLAARENVQIRYYSVIYDAIEDVKQALTGMLAPEMKEQIIGLAEVREVYRSSKIGSIAGCMVIDGQVKRNKPIRVLRDSVVIYEGELESLRRFKEDVPEVRNGMECGIGVKDYNDVKVGDQIEVFDTVEVKRQL